MSPKEIKPQIGLNIKCRGQYYYRDERQKGIKQYEVEVKAPSLSFFEESTQRYAGVDQDNKPIYNERKYVNVRGILKKRLLPVILRNKFPDFARIRFVTIEEIVSLDGERLDLPLTLRSRNQLHEMTVDKNIPIDVREYLEIDELRTDIMEYLEDSTSFLERKPSKDAKRSEEKAFLEMNQLDETLPPEKKKAKSPKKRTDLGIADNPMAD